ncbi:hypothetical protein BHYA_0080g00280 [Botrytis hyacinthi]|uniref:Uncharacterized protein n=1 Tax=Botrytis hyacinthi TaxID=278943 RepID=A0A4Z1GSI4_9HELO|nr:hypothetical protein BHYA_0080g00280 [Botrytis hyacinthi]
MENAVFWQIKLELFFQISSRVGSFMVFLIILRLRNAFKVVGGYLASARNSTPASGYKLRFLFLPTLTS